MQSGNSSCEFLHSAHSTIFLTPCLTVITTAASPFSSLKLSNLICLSGPQQKICGVFLFQYSPDKSCTDSSESKKKTDSHPFKFYYPSLSCVAASCLFYAQMQMLIICLRSPHLSLRTRYCFYFFYVSLVFLRSSADQSYKVIRVQSAELISISGHTSERARAAPSPTILGIKGKEGPFFCDYTSFSFSPPPPTRFIPEMSVLSQ